MIRPQSTSETHCGESGSSTFYNTQALLAGYHTIGSRYASTTAFQWRVPAFGLTANAALLAGILNTRALATHITMAAASMVVAVAALAITRRVELTAWWDRSMMDAYERVLLPARFRLQHEDDLAERLEVRPFALGQPQRSLELQLKVVMRADPSLIINLALIVMSSTCIALTALTG